MVDFKKLPNGILRNKIDVMKYDGEPIRSGISVYGTDLASHTYIYFPFDHVLTKEEVRQFADSLADHIRSQGIDQEVEDCTDPPSKCLGVTASFHLRDPNNPYYASSGSYVLGDRISFAGVSRSHPGIFVHGIWHDGSSSHRMSSLWDFTQAIRSEAQG
jgi:hypothetical protein